MRALGFVVALRGAVHGTTLIYILRAVLALAPPPRSARAPSLRFGPREQAWLRWVRGYGVAALVLSTAVVIRGGRT